MFRHACLVALCGISCGSGAENRREAPPSEAPDTGPFFSERADCGIGVAPGTHPDLIRWPYVQSVTDASAIIAWGSPVEEQTGYLHYGTSGDYGIAIPSDVSEIPSYGDTTLAIHSVELTGLEPGTEYCYQVQVGDHEIAGALRFRTAPDSPYAPARFFAFGDLGTSTPDQLAIRDRMLAQHHDIDLWFTTGDNAYPAGTHQAYQAHVFSIYREMWTRIPVFPVPGNHDYITENAQPYLDNFFLPRNAWREEDKERYYSIDWGPIHFVGLDSEDPMFQLDGEDDMVAWVDADLAATDKPWKIVAWHRPPYEGHPTRAPDVATWYHLVPLMQKHGVQLVLLGHNHFYERMVPILDNAPSSYRQGAVTYVVTGSAGRSLYDIAPWEFQAVGIQDFNYLIGDVSFCELRLQAYNGDGEKLDDFTIPRCF